MIPFSSQKPNVCPLCNAAWKKDQEHSNPSFTWWKCSKDDQLWLIEGLLISNDFGIHKVIGDHKIVWWSYEQQPYIVWNWGKDKVGQSTEMESLPLDLTEDQLKMIKVFR